MVYLVSKFFILKFLFSVVKNKDSQKTPKFWKKIKIVPVNKFFYVSLGIILFTAYLKNFGEEASFQQSFFSAKLKKKNAEKKL